MDVEHSLVLVAQAIEANDVGTLRDTITDVLAAKQHLEMASNPSFASLLGRLVTNAKRSEEEIVVLVLAELGRLKVSLRSKGDFIDDLVYDLIGDRLPKSFRYGDGDQRYYAALSCAPPRITVGEQLLARTIVQEDTGEKARKAWTRKLLEAYSIGIALHQLGQALAELPSEATADPGSSRARRLRRILRALLDECAAGNVLIVDSLEQSVESFVRSAFRGVKRPEDFSIAKEAAEEFVVLLHQLMRFRLRLVTEAAIYLSLEGVSSWLPEGGWLRLTGSSPSVVALRSTLLEGLLVLAKQGLPDDRLIRAHRVLSQSESASLQDLKALAEREIGLPQAIRQWLASGGRTKVTATVAGLDDSDDLAIAMAMIASNHLLKEMSRSRNETLPELRLRLPGHAETLERLASMGVELGARISALAARRGLRLFGEIGEIVDFLPAAHRLADETSLQKKVCVQTPGVERRGISGARVIVPALVAPLEQPTGGAI